MIASRGVVSIKLSMTHRTMLKLVIRCIVTQHGLQHITNLNIGRMGHAQLAWETPQGAGAAASGVAAVDTGAHGSTGAFQSGAGQHQLEGPFLGTYSSGSGSEGGSGSGGEGESEEARLRNGRREGHRGRGRPVAEQEEHTASLGHANMHASILNTQGAAVGFPRSQDEREGSLGEITAVPPLPPRPPLPPPPAPLPHTLSLPSEITEVTEISEAQEEGELAQQPLQQPHTPGSWGAGYKGGRALPSQLYTQQAYTQGRRKPWVWIDEDEDEQGQGGRALGARYRGGRAVAEAEERPGTAAGVRPRSSVGNRPGTATGNRPGTKGSARPKSAAARPKSATAGGRGGLGQGDGKRDSGGSAGGDGNDDADEEEDEPVAQDQRQRNKAKTIFKILYGSQDPFAVFVKTACEPTGKTDLALGFRVQGLKF
ncbi:hypothetical protein DUNSADRAFT_5007, partial [Dunaliella salina]